MFALGGRAFTKSLADRLDLPFPLAEENQSSITPAACLWIAKRRSGSYRGRRRGHLGGGRRVCDRGAGRRRPSAGPDLPLRRRLAPAGDRPRLCESEKFWKRLPFSRPPEIVVMEPIRWTRIKDGTNLLIDQQDVTPLGLAYQAIELQTNEDPLDVALRRVLRAMKM
jgi:hypothetical protein